MGQKIKLILSSLVFCLSANAHASDYARNDGDLAEDEGDPLAPSGALPPEGQHSLPAPMEQVDDDSPGPSDLGFDAQDAAKGGQKAGSADPGTAKPGNVKPTAPKPGAKKGSDIPSDDSLFEENSRNDRAGSADSDIGINDMDRRQIAEFRMGPALALGFPYTVNYSADMIHSGRWGGAFSFGTNTTKSGETKVTLRNFDLRARWFPLKNDWFLGLAVGGLTATGDVKRASLTPTSGGAFDATASFIARTTYLTPHVGWFRVWECGFMASADVGYQLALSGSEKVSSKVSGSTAPLDSEDPARSSDDFKIIENDANEVGKKYSKTNFFYATILRLGWIF